MEAKQESKMRQIKHKVEEESVAINSLVDTIVNRYNKELHEFIEQVRGWLRANDKLTSEELEKLIIQIPVFMYFASEGLEKLGVEGDNSKAVKMEAFNNIYIETAGTIEDRKKASELATLPEYYVEVAYTRAYKKLKTQIEKAEHIFTGAKKILDKRVSETNLNLRDRHGS